MKPFKFASGLVMVVLLTSGPSWASVLFGVDPSYVKVKVYEVRVSQNANCTGGVTVYRDNAPSYTDWTNGPTLGAGAVPNGSYNCVMLKMSDYIHYTPATLSGSWSHGVCAVGTDYVLDVAHDESAIDPDGVSQSLGPRGTENIVWLYVRTGGALAGSQSISAWIPTGGIALTSPLVISGDRSQTMVFDFSGRVGESNDSGWSCNCEAPTMGFR